MIIAAVRDRAVDAFGQPIFAPHIGQIVRSFTDEVNRADSEFNKHPEDYDLYEIGTFEPSTGIVTGGTPRMVAVGKDVRVNNS